MTYKVVGPLVLAKNDEGVIRYKYAGALIGPGEISDSLAEQLVADGLIVEAGGAAVEPAEPAEGGKPAQDATKAELIAWLVENAVDEDGGDYTESKLQPHNKAQLWDLINAVED